MATTRKINNLIRDYKIGKRPVTYLAEKYGMTRQRVYSIIHKHGVTLRHQKHAGKRKDRTEMIQDYTDTDMTLQQIADKHGVHVSYVSSILSEHGVSGTRKPRVTKTQQTKIVKLFKGGESAYNIGSNLGISHVTVYRVLERNGMGKAPTSYDQNDVDAWVSLFKNGATITQIAEKHHVSAPTLRKYLRLEGVMK